MVLNYDTILMKLRCEFLICVQCFCSAFNFVDEFCTFRTLSSRCGFFRKYLVTGLVVAFYLET